MAGTRNEEQGWVWPGQARQARPGAVKSPVRPQTARALR